MDDNGRTIGELRFKNAEIFAVKDVIQMVYVNLCQCKKRTTEHVTQAKLVDEAGKLNPLARRIFVKWFNEFSTDGKMSKKQCAQYT